MATASREGSLDAPTRHPLGQNEPEFYDETALFDELERVFDICHGCRRCVSLCNSFPTLFDLVDESSTMEVDGVDRKDYWKVVDHCYLCDLCYLTKCPYVPPHEWNVDFPHLMLRAKALGFKQGRSKFRDKVITSTDKLGKLASIPIVVNVVNAVNRNEHTRALLESSLGIHPRRGCPSTTANRLSKRSSQHRTKSISQPADRSHYRQGRYIRNLLRRIQRTRRSAKICSPCSNTTASRRKSCATAFAAACPSLNWAISTASRKLKDHNIPLLANWWTTAGTSSRRCPPARCSSSRNCR